MTIKVPPVAAVPAALPFKLPEPSTSEARWLAWQERGAVRDRALRRRVTFAAPVLLFVAVIVIYMLLGR